METHSLSASTRAAEGKGAARKVRKAGKVPGVLYRAGGEAASLSFDLPELAAIFRKTADPNTVVTVHVDGAPHSCLVREIQRDPVTREVLHVDFYEVSPDQKVTATVVVNPVGRALGTRAGGTLRVITRQLTVRCPAGQIPAKLDVDVSNLDIGQFLRASDVPAPEGVQVTFARDFNVVTVVGKRAAPAAAAAAPAAEKKGKK